ncbi:MAG: hypothetical protein ACTHLE_03105 [Agriterribacter sp.]
MSFLQAAMILFAVVYALLNPIVYTKETESWRIQSVGQDIVSGVLLIPLLIVSSIRARQKRSNALYIWGGIQMYLLYTFVIYAFAVHFNALFLLYCAILGISFYSLLWYGFEINEVRLQLPAKTATTAKVVAGYFIMTSLLFLFLWLAVIIPATVTGSQPAQLADNGLFTNPVHVLDLSVVLPAFFLTAMALLTQQRVAYLLASSLLCFTALMNVTITFLLFFMQYNKPQSSAALLFNMLLLSAISIILLKMHLSMVTKYCKTAGTQFLC